VDRYSQRFDFKEFDEYWLNCLNEALPSKYWSNRSDERYDRLLASDPVLEDVTEKRFSKSVIESWPARLLQDALAPDAILIQAFESWLRDFRKNSPLPIGRAGKPALNLKITSAHLDSWTNYNILAVLDLDLYDKAKKRRKLTHPKLFEKLNPKVVDEVVDIEGGPNPEGWGIEARSKAEEALGCLYSLIAQAKFSRMN
jgi:hypothetical protein